MADSLWISEQSLIDNSVVIDSIDFKTITPNIIWVQDEYVQKVLGTDLFNEINGQIIANTMTALNTTLMNSWIQKMIVNYLLAECSYDMVYRWTNKGIVTKNAENSQTVTVEQLASIQARYKYRGQSYGQRLTDYLCQENASYPLYNSNTDYSDLKPKNISANTGIWMEDQSDEVRRQIRFGNY